jgi:hypothetical protein
LPPPALTFAAESDRMIIGSSGTVPAVTAAATRLQLAC